MALDLFKFLRRNRKTKKNYDPSKIMDSTEYLKGAKNTRVEIGKPVPEVIGGGANTRMNIAPLSVPRRRIGTNDPEMGYEGTVKPLGIQRPRSEDQPDRNVVLMGIAAKRAARKEANKKRYQEQIKARNKRSGFLKKGRTAAERQATYDTAFSRPLGENTMLGRASANRAQRQIDMKKFYEASKKKREAAKRKK
jgi:hypothetical protein